MVFVEQVPIQRRRKRFVLATATFRLAMMLIYHDPSPSFPLLSHFVSLSHLALYSPCHLSFRSARPSSVFMSTSTYTELRPRPLCSSRRLRPEPSVLILRVRLDELVLQLRLQRVLVVRMNRTCLFLSDEGKRLCGWSYAIDNTIWTMRTPTLRNQEAPTYTARLTLHGTGSGGDCEMDIFQPNQRLYLIAFSEQMQCLHMRDRIKRGLRRTGRSVRCAILFH